jgi:small-conductance mechanosensitive channel/CRP-like cAMP-binding protein
MNALRKLDFSSEMVGIPLAFLLLVLAVALLPAGQRRRARQGAALLAASLLLGVLHLLFPNDAVAERFFLFAATFCLLASMGRSVVLLALDVVIERRTARNTPRIFRDLSTGVTYLLVGLVALRSVGVEPGSILTTSALLTAVVGLAMQDTLGNLVSGLALQLQAPFDVGDWIEFDSGQQAGRVTEITWRATSIMTLDQVEVILPNATLAKAAIRNYSRPSTVSRRRVTVGVSYAVAPIDVHAALVAAVTDTPGVLPSPAPFVRTQKFADSAIEYDVMFFIDDYGLALRIDSSVRDRIYYELARRGFEIPFPTRTIFTATPVDAIANRDELRRRREATLNGIDFVRPLPADARAVLAERATLRVYGPGEAIVRKGDPSRELFVIDRGAVAVEVARDGGRVAEVAQLTAGQSFGEMGLLTGEVRSATVRAKTLCHLVVVDHDAFQDVLASHPEVVERLGVLLASRQAELEAAAAPSGRRVPPTEDRSRRLISQIREFFKLV